MTDIKTEQDRILAVIIAGAISNISDEHAFRAVTALREAGYPLGWQPIETAPKGDDDFFLVCGVGDVRSPFVVRGSIRRRCNNGG